MLNRVATGGIFFENDRIAFKFDSSWFFLVSGF
jgi:hypothetical protein